MNILRALWVAMIFFTVTSSYGAPVDFTKVDFMKLDATYKWLDIADSRSYRSLYINSYFELSGSIAFDQYFSNEKSEWKLVQVASYGRVGAVSTVWSKVQIAQKPATIKDVMVEGIGFIEHRQDPSRRLLVNAAGQNLAISFNNKKERSRKDAQKLHEVLERLSITHSVYRGNVLEFKPTGLLGFLDRAESNNFTWNDFIFDEDEKKLLVDDIDSFIKNYDEKKWKAFGAPLNRGVLLHGEPGTGKSFVGKILISNVLRGGYGKDVTYFHIQARHIYDRQVIKRIYDTARLMTPAIIFIEDVDLIAGTDRSHRSEIKNELMQQLSGLEKLHGVITIATTNLGSKIDPALRRSKRLGFQHYVGYPGISDRLRLLKLFTKDLGGMDEVDLQEIADKTDRMTGADIREFISLTMEQAIRRPENDPKKSTNKKIRMNQRDFDRAFKLRKNTKLSR